jgi:hypothetical protein
MYEAGFTAGSLARNEVRGGTRGTGNKVSFDKELTGGWEVAEGDAGKKVVSGATR